MKKTDIKQGTRFGYWTVIEPPDATRHDYVRCRCICGREINRNNSTGVPGVSVFRNGQYRAYISIGKKQIHLGFFDKLDDAKAARKAAEQRYFADRQEKADEIKEQIKKGSSK